MGLVYASLVSKPPESRTRVPEANYNHSNIDLLTPAGIHGDSNHQTPFTRLEHESGILLEARLSRRKYPLHSVCTETLLERAA
jgi:hypothetical protein